RPWWPGTTARADRRSASGSDPRLHERVVVVGGEPGLVVAQLLVLEEPALHPSHRDRGVVAAGEEIALQVPVGLLALRAVGLLERALGQLVDLGVGVTAVVAAGVGG